MMNSHFTKRRPYGYDHDPPEHLLENPPLVSPFQGSVGYPFSHHHLSPEVQNPIAQTENIIHVPQYGEFLDFSGPYHQQQLQDHNQAYQEQHQQYYQEYRLYPRKRQRLDTNMPIPLFSQGNPGQDDHEKSPVSGQSEREDGSRGSLMGALGSCLGVVGMCPPYTTYETVPAYQSAPSVTGYDSAVSRAYSAELLSPVRAPIQEYPAVTSSGPGQTGLFDIEDPAHTAHLPNYPPLQPVSHYGSQPTTSPESMVYPSLDTNQGFLKSETSPVFLKSEGVGQGFRAPGFPNVSTPMQPGESSYAHDGVSRAEDGSYIRHGLINYQLPPRYRITHAYAQPDVLASEQADHCPIVSQGNGLEVVLPNHKPPSTKRGPFKNQEKRQQTAHVRKIGSCIRCRMQRIRCEINSEAPEDDDAPCDGCKKILANSKIHRLPCRRWKITEVKLFKPGQVKGYEWTCRWKDGTAGPDIGQWENPEVKIIRLTEGYGDGVELRVRRFVPQPGDKLERTWVENGKMQRRWIEPYALIDLDAAKASYETYLRSGLTKMCKALLGPTEKLLWRTYEFAILRAQSPNTTEEERELIRKTLDLWAAVRLTTKSFEIIGKETLGIPKAKGQPVPIPPVMGAQIDNILLNQTLPKLRRETLETLQTMTQAKKPKTWLTTYLVSFILLHNVALITAHDEGYAKKHGMQTRFARKDMVEQYHLGANIFLAYYHYCNKSVYPFSKECKDSDLQNLAELDQTSINFVKYTRSYVGEHKSQWQELRAAKKYGNDYYFLSQLYEQDWSPQPTIVD